MPEIRSLIFTIIFYLWISAAMILSLPFIFFYPVIYKLHHYWARSVMWLFRVIIGCDYRIEGLENLPVAVHSSRFTVHSQESSEKLCTVHCALSTNPQGFVIASKHQSAWETIVAFALFPKVAFVYKKELGYIPVYGWYNIAFRNIKVDRAAGPTSLKKIVGQTIDRVRRGHQVIIFPQGTRTLHGVDSPYRSSVYAMYKEGLPVYPAALNSGGHWPKNGIKHPGTIVWKFLPKIEEGLSRDEFMARLESVVESESGKLNS